MMKWADPFCKTTLEAWRSPCRTPRSWIKQSSLSSWWLFINIYWSWMRPKKKFARKKTDTPLMDAEVFYTATHIVHNQCFEMLRAEEPVDFRYAPSLQIWQNIVDTSFSLQHLCFPILQGVLLIVCCAINTCPEAPCPIHLVSDISIWSNHY